MIKKSFLAQYGVFVLTAALIVINGLNLRGVCKFRCELKNNPVPEPGAEFSLFLPYLKDTREAGFLTNNDLRDEKNFEMFLLAQYRLAPAVLNLNEIHPDFNILDYTKPVWAIYTMKSLRAEPLAATPSKQVLAVRRP